MNTADALVHVDAVTRKFPLDHSSVTALDHTSLCVAPGEFLAIAGPSGSGKSTLLNLIGCIDKPTSGRVLIDGVDTSLLSSDRTTALRREKIGFVFQTFNLIPVFTAAENVEFPLLIQGVSANERRIRVTEALGSVGLAARASSPRFALGRRAPAGRRGTRHCGSPCAGAGRRAHCESRHAQCDATDRADARPESPPRTHIHLFHPRPAPA